MTSDALPPLDPTPEQEDQDVEERYPDTEGSEGAGDEPPDEAPDTAREVGPYKAQ